MSQLYDVPIPHSWAPPCSNLAKHFCRVVVQCRIEVRTGNQSFDVHAAQYDRPPIRLSAKGLVAFLRSISIVAVAAKSNSRSVRQFGFDRTAKRSSTIGGNVPGIVARTWSTSDAGDCSVLYAGSCLGITAVDRGGAGLDRQRSDGQ